MIEARRERKSAGAAEPAIGRLEPEQAAERGGHADRAVGVGAERERHQSAGYGGCRPARRSAGHAVKIMRIARRTVVNILAGEIIGVFAHVQRADQDGAGAFQPLDQRCVAGRWSRVAVDLRARKRRHAGDVEQIFHRERHAGQRRRRFAPGAGVVKRPGTRQRALLGDGGEGIEQRIAGADTRQRRFNDVQRADAARTECSGNVRRGLPGKVERDRFKHGTPGQARFRQKARTRRPVLRG